MFFNMINFVMNSTILILLMFFTWLIVEFSSLNKHLTIYLIMLESMFMISMLMLLTHSLAKGIPLMVILLLFCASVIEAAIGLSLISSLSRKLSSELLKYNILFFNMIHYM